MNNNIRYPKIPNNVVVHLGKPDEASRQITVPFTEYIKNVASSEIYPTWPIEAIEANTLAIISFTLNRIYNEWYKSKGYNFDITSDPSIDQTFIEDREIYDSISQVVDRIFNDYIVKGKQIQPLFAEYCDGKTSSCDGLSQWGSVELANKGNNSNNILKNYYGNDIEIVYNAEVADVEDTYPGYPIERGIAGDMVRTIQRELNRISQNYPAIPTIPEINGVYNIETENAVKKFQEIFNLPQTGIVDKTTWYKGKYIYNAVKKLNDLYSEGLTIEEAQLKYPEKLKYSDSGIFVRVLHYYLDLIAKFDSELPSLEINGVFNENTKAMVINFQNKYGLNTTGEVDSKTWIKLKEVYNNTLENIPDQYLEESNKFYPGEFLTKGMTGSEIIRLQKFLLRICQKNHNIPGVIVNGEFDDLTEQSVKKIQQTLNQAENGAVGPITWDSIVKLSEL